MKVAVLLATYNGEKYLPALLDSLFSQTFGDFCCYIHDDGSTDQTREIIESYRNREPDRVYIIEGEAMGGAKNNFLFLLQKVEADYYFFCDQDDVWFPEKIETELNALLEMKNEPNGALVFSDLNVTDSSLNITDDSFMKLNRSEPENLDFYKAVIAGKAPGCVMAFDRRVRDQSIGYRNADNIYMHDWWMLIVAYGIDAGVKYLDIPLMYYRQHEDNTLGAKKSTVKSGTKNLISQILHGKLYEKREWIERPRRQANELIYIENVDERYLDFLKQLANVSKKNKLQRVAFYRRYFKETPGLWYRMVWV